MTTGHALDPWVSPSTASISRRLPLSEEAASHSKLRVGMPHLNAGGLSESWLFRHAGDQHWQALGARWGGTTDDLRSELGARLYPTFLAIRASYAEPLSAVRENDALATGVDLSWAARGYCHSRITLTSERNRMRLEMLTMLAERSRSLVSVMRL